MAHKFCAACVSPDVVALVAMTAENVGDVTVGYLQSQSRPETIEKAERLGLVKLLRSGAGDRPSVSNRTGTGEKYLYSIHLTDKGKALWQQIQGCVVGIAHEESNTGPSPTLVV